MREFEDEQLLCARVDTAALRRAQSGDPDDALPVADQRNQGPTPGRDFRLDQEFLQFLLPGQPERPEAVPLNAAPDEQRRVDAVQVKRHA